MSQGAPNLYGLLALVLASLVLFVTLLPSAVADQTTDEADGPASLQAVYVTTPPTIDGLLDDAAWREATHINEFSREKVAAPPLHPTEAWICCDERAIYIAFRCEDSEPREIRCNQKKRQGHIWQDDRVVLGLDVNNTGRNWYSFQATAAGTQFDDVPGGTSEKIEWRGDWHAAAAIDESGWSAEIEVPFSILRYPNGQDTFRIYLSRVLAREQDWCTWPPAFARVWDTDNCARWTDLTTPPVPFRCVLMPYALSVLSEDEEDHEPLTGGLNLKGTWPNGVVALATYNPDFRNIEDVVETIDFTYVERWLPEYRPFFREGEWRSPPDNLFYSRRIEDFDAGIKAFGSLGSKRFGILDTYGRGGENHLALDFEHLFGTTGSVGASLVDRRVPDEPRNLAYGLRGDCRRNFEGGNRYLFASTSATHTQGEGGDDHALDMGTGMFQINGWGYHVGHSTVGSEFQADDGYVPESGVRSFFSEVSHQQNYDEGSIRHQRWGASVHRGQSEDGVRRGVHLSHSRDWRSDRGLWIGGSVGERDGFDESSYWIGGDWNNQDTYRKGYADYTWGERYNEPYRYQGIAQSFHPTEKWSGELRAERSYAVELDDDGNLTPADWSRQLVLTNTYDVSDERTISARLVCSGGNTNFYAAYRQRVRVGTDLLIVVGDPNADEWVSRVAVKAIWCY